MPTTGAVMVDDGFRSEEDDNDGDHGSTGDQRGQAFADWLHNGSAVPQQRPLTPPEDVRLHGSLVQLREARNAEIEAYAEATAPVRTHTRAPNAIG